MPLRLRVGRKGYIILPKAVREALGIEEGDEVIVEVRDAIIIRPAKRSLDEEQLRRALRRHAERLRRLGPRREPRPGEAAQHYLEEEFEE